MDLSEELSGLVGWWGGGVVGWWGGGVVEVGWWRSERVGVVRRAVWRRGAADGCRRRPADNRGPEPHDPNRSLLITVLNHTLVIAQDYNESGLLGLGSGRCFV